MPNIVDAQEFLATVTNKLRSAAGEIDFVVDEFQELASDMFVAFLIIGTVKIKVVSHRDYLEYRLGPLTAPNEVGDKVDGTRVWFFPESIRDFLRGRARVCEDEIFGKTKPVAPADSLSDFGQMISSILPDLQGLFDPKGFGAKHKDLDDYELNRAAQISEISNRRYQ